MRTPCLIEATGFKAYLQGMHLPILPGCIFILGDNQDYPDSANSNGSGKTSILDTICWCFYGKMLDGSTPTLAEVKHVMAAKSSVIITFDDGAQIHREVTNKENLAYRFSQYQEWVEGDLRETQRQVDEHVLGIGWKTFQSTCILSAAATASQFLRAKPAERSQMLSQLVDDLIFQKAGKAMKEDQEKISKDFHDHNLDITFIEREITKEQESKVRLEQKLVEETAALGHTRHLLDKEMDALSEKMVAIKNLIESPPNSTLTQARVEEELYKVNGVITTLRREQMECELLANKECWNAGDVCPQCERTITPQDAERMESRANDAEEHLGLLGRQLATAVTQQQTLNNQLLAFHQYRVQIQSWQNEYQAHYSRYLMLKDQKERDPLTELRSRIQDLQTNIQGRAKRMQECRAAMAELATKADTLKQLIPGFTTEIRNILFDQIRVELDDITYRNLQKMAKGMFTITYPNQNKGNREKFEIQVMRNGITRDLSTYSEGEAWRASCAVLFSLRSVMLSQSRAKVNLLLVDDPAGELDDVGKSLFFDVLSRIQQDENILMMITTPAKTVPPMANSSIIRVTFRNDVATAQ